MAKKRIKKARIDFISLCPRGKNYLPVLYKEDDSVAIQAETILVKASEEQIEKGEVLALVYVPEKVDADGELASAEVIKEMAYSHAKNGSKLDIRHDNTPIAKEAAFTAETFIVQKGDPRFAGVQDAQGNTVDATGGWGVVIKLEDPTLKKLYKEGAWQGVSMGGAHLAPPEVIKENKVMDEKLMSAFAETIVKGIVAGLTPILKAKEPEKPAEPKADEGLVFKGDPTDLKAVRAFRKAKEREMLQKAVNWNDPEAVKAYEDALEKELEAEKAEKASGQVVKGKDGDDEQFPEGTPKIIKEGATLGSRLATHVNKSRGRA